MNETINEYKTFEVQLCPHCKVALECKMFDIDGLNLEEHAVCPKCGYGQPALR